MLKRTLPILTILFAAAFFSQAAADTATIVIQKGPSKIIFKSEPELTVIPGTYVYYTSSENNDIFFYEGFWWRSWQGGWYRSEVYTGPWVVVENRRVPNAVNHMPPRWKESRNDAVKVKWNDTRSHWREWQRDKYWDKRGWKRDDRRKNENNNNNNDRDNQRKDNGRRGHR